MIVVFKTPNVREQQACPLKSQRAGPGSMSGCHRELISPRTGKNFHIEKIV